MPSRSLPARPSLEHLRNQAKDLLKAYRSGDPSAVERFRESLPHLPKSADADPSLSLRDAHRVVASEYGFPGWVEMRTHIERKENHVMFEVTVDHVKISPVSEQRVVILKATEVNKYLPIWIGRNEGDAIALKLQGQELPRPMTHDLMDSMIRNLGATVTQVVVTDLTGDMFLAKVVMESNGTTIESDSRPSDAIALAVRCGAPVFVEDAVLDRGGVEYDPDTGEPSSAIGRPPGFSRIHVDRELSDQALGVLRQAGAVAGRRGHPEIEPEDMLLALVDEVEGVGAKVLVEMGADLGAIRSSLEEEAGGEDSQSDSIPELSERSQRVVRLAKMETLMVFTPNIGTEHLLLGLVISDDGLASAVLKEHGVEIESARAGVMTALQATEGSAE